MRVRIVVLSINIDVPTKKNASEAIRKAQRQRMEDAMAKGFATSQELVPEDRGAGGGLRGSGFEPTWNADGSIQYGYRAAHAAPIEEGTQPFWAPIQPLIEWADRVVGDPGFGYYVQWKIAQEGIAAQPYLEPSAKEVERWLNSRSFGDYLSDEL